MQQVAIVRAGAFRHDAPLLRRFLTKLLVDVLPATLTSVAGGLLVAHYQFGYPATRPAAEQVAAPASVEMVQLVRDEHTAIMDYLRAETAAEKSRNAAADAADARAAAEARAILEAPPVAPQVRAAPASVVTPKAASVRSKAAVAAPVLPPHEPLIVAQAVPAPVPVAPPKSLLERTLDLKDHVVGATLHAVTAIGDIPSWITSMGNRDGNASPAPNPGPDAANRSFAS